MLFRFLLFEVVNLYNISAKCCSHYDCRTFACRDVLRAFLLSVLTVSIRFFFQNACSADMSTPKRGCASVVLKTSVMFDLRMELSVSVSKGNSVGQIRAIFCSDL